MPHDNLQKYVSLSEDKGLSLVVTIGPRENRRMIAEGRYVFGEDDPYPDVAIMVNEQYKGRGIGTFLLEYLIEIAKERGIEGFRADVLPDNDPMLWILRKLPYRSRKQYSNGVLEIRFSFDDLKDEPSP
jgi:GNAT superfamily N-acetyltransferase